MIPNPIERCIQAFSDLRGREQGIVFTPSHAGTTGFGIVVHVCNQLPDEIKTVCIIDFWTTGRDASRQKRQARTKFIVVDTAVSHTIADGTFTLKGVAETDYVVHADIYVKPGYRKFCGQDEVARTNQQPATVKFVLDRQGADCGN